MRLFRIFFQRLRNRFDFWLAVAAKRVHVRFHADEIDHAAEAPLTADRQLQRNNVAAEYLLERFQRTLKTCEFAIHPGENESAGNIVLRAKIPNFFRGDLRADMRVDGNECGVRGDERSFRFVDKSAVPGEIDEIYFYVAAAAKRAGPFRVRQARLQ